MGSPAATRAWKRRNKARVSAYNKTYDETQPERRQSAREKSRLKKYGLTPEAYERILEAQGGCCALCFGPPNGAGRFHVDHDHASKEVRGLLCANCNFGLGRFKDSPATLARAIEYLARSEGREDTLCL